MGSNVDPSDAAALSGQSEPQSAGAPDGVEHRPTILIVDDDEVFVELLSDELSAHFQVEWAKDGQTALAAVVRRRPDAIFLDHGLPDGPGVGLIDEFRKVGCEAPVVMLTASQDVRVAAQAMRGGAVDFIIKDVKDSFYEDIVPAAARAVDTWNSEKELEYLRDQEEERARRALELNQALRHKNRQIEQAYQEIEASHKQLRQKNQRLSELYETAHRFVDNVSHEMRTPLTVIKEFMAICLDGLAGELNEQQKEYLGIAMAKTNDLARMVDDMLDISKIEAGLLRVDRTVCHLDEIVAVVQSDLQQQSRSHNTQLDVALGEGLPPLYCDREKLGRTLINLVVNAVKFSPEGGIIHVWTKRTERDDEIFVGITDQGPGIASEHLKVIFDRFKQVGEGRRSSTKGFGLGLNIVRELVHLNLGDVYVESERGKGSLFGFTIPVFDHELLMRRYVERMHRFVNRADRIVFLQACAAQPGGHIGGHVRDFLAQHVSAFDLVFERAAHGDAILVAFTDDAEALLSRLQLKNREELRMSPGSTVDMEFHIIEQRPATSDVAPIAEFFAGLFEQAQVTESDVHESPHH